MSFCLKSATTMRGGGINKDDGHEDEVTYRYLFASVQIRNKVGNDQSKSNVVPLGNS